MLNSFSQVFFNNASTSFTVFTTVINILTYVFIYIYLLSLVILSSCLGRCGW